MADSGLIARRRLRHLRANLRRRGRRFNAMVDAELIVPFQKYVYYPIIIGFTVYLMFAGQGMPQGVDDVMAYPAYVCWLILGSVFPALSLFGRYLYDSSLKRALGEPNSAYGGASFMLAGDAGVWAAICIYLSCVVGTAWWGQPFWGLAFVLMGVPGGGIFTYRSWRRLRQIKDRLP